MATENRVPKRGHRVLGRIISVKGQCVFGHEAGDELELSFMSTGGLCVDFYRSLFPFIMTLQFGGKFPDEYSWGGEKLEMVCPDCINAARIQLRREGVDPSRHPVYLKDEADEERKWRKRLGISEE